LLNSATPSVRNMIARMHMEELPAPSDAFRMSKAFDSESRKFVPPASTRLLLI